MANSQAPSIESQSMDLRDFVAATLTQIVAGVVDSSKKIADYGGAVNPIFTGGANGTHLGYGRGDNNSPIYGVEFDVAIVAGSNVSGEGGASVKVAGIFSLGGKGGGSAKEETTSRIKFLVPLQLPADAVSRAAAENELQESIRQSQILDERLHG